jgi:hypothetical protein
VVRMIALLKVWLSGLLLSLLAVALIVLVMP